jgi:hypothetical protein
MRIVRCAVVAIVLFSTVFCGFALSKESWAVVSYIEVNDSIQNQVFKEMSGKNKDNAIRIATDVCVTYGQSRKTSSECKLIGTCSRVGWFAIASMVKSIGHVGIGCGKDSEKEAVEAAKNACGSPGCAKIFTHEIKK